MSEELIILKLGGAAITDKNTAFTARGNIITQIFEELKDIDKNIILIHGAGSFAHTLAKEYKVAHGLHESLSLDFQLSGVTKIRNSMQRLHQFVLDEGEVHNLKTFSLPISSTLITKGQDQVAQKFFLPYRHALNLGFIPVSYGDMSFDVTKAGFLVVSGDRVIKLLAEYFSDYEIRVIFGSDVDGLYDKDPKFEDANLLDNIRFEEIEQWIEVAGASKGIDVTGGMEGKLRQIHSISQFVQQIDIINLTVPGRLRDCIEGIDNISTTFYNN